MSSNNLITLLENFLLTPGSSFYLSTILYNPDGKAADPLDIATLDIGTFDVDEGPHLQIGATLKNVVIKGLSNTQVKLNSENKPEITVAGDQVTFYAKQPNTQDGYQRPADVPNEIELTSELDISLNGTAMPPGTLSTTIKTVDNIVGVFNATQQDPNNFQTVSIQVTKFEAEPSVNDGNIKVDINIQSIFKSVINEIINQPSNLQKIVDALNQQLAQPKLLEQISNTITEQARKALSSL